jgi:hypothetical protein
MKISSRYCKYTTINNTEVYGLHCTACRKVCVGQPERPITTRYQEHTRYITTNNPNSAYAPHILNNQHGYGHQENTLHMLKTCHKGNLMSIWETFHMQQLHHLQLLTHKQSPKELNQLNTLGRTSRQLATLDKL